MSHHPKAPWPYPATHMDDSRITIATAPRPQASLEPPAAPKQASPSGTTAPDTHLTTVIEVKVASITTLPVVPQRAMPQAAHSTLPNLGRMMPKPPPKGFGTQSEAPTHVRRGVDPRSLNSEAAPKAKKAPPPGLDEALAAPSALPQRATHEVPATALPAPLATALSTDASMASRAAQAQSKASPPDLEQFGWAPGLAILVALITCFNILKTCEQLARKMF